MAVKGILDLSDWDFNKNGPARLYGEWGFYWDQLLTPNDFNTLHPPDKTGFFKVPGGWGKKVVNGTPLKLKGHATLRLKIRMPEDNTPILFNTSTYLSSWKVWLDGKLLAKAGETSKKSSQLIIRAPVMHHIKAEGRILECIVQVSTYSTNPYIGATFKMSIGKYEDLQLLPTGAVENLNYGGFLLPYLGGLMNGALLFMGLYHATFFLFRKKDRSYLYFSAVCILYGMTSTVYGWDRSHLFQIWGNHDSFLICFTLSQISIFLVIPALTMYIHSLFPRECAMAAVRISQIIGITFGLFRGFMVVYTGDNPIIEALILTMGGPVAETSFFIISLVLILYLFAITTRAFFHKKPNANLVFGSILVCLVCLFIDTMHLYFDFSLFRVIPIGIFFMLVSQSFILARRFSLFFVEVERLSSELSQKNIELTRMDKLKDDFLATTSHELRTPLNGIIGMVESLMAGAAGKPSDKAMAGLSMVFSSAKRLAGLVNDILDFSRLKNRDIELSKKPVDIKPLVSSVMAVTQNLIGSKDLALTQSIPENIPLVWGDENRLQQILYNLLGNAVKFTEKGEIHVKAVQKDTMVQIAISDTGLGIAKDEQEKIFKSFEQVDSTPARPFEGTGLGLSITRHLVELHGGDIRVESIVGKGSTFYFTLPVATIRAGTDTASDANVMTPDVFELPEVQKESSGPASANPLQSRESEYQVLVVDDDPVNLQVVANHLSLENISFCTASDGEAALKRIETGETPRIILLDIMMPKITGYDVCRTLRKTFSPAQLPIIMLTAKNHVADLVEAYKAGASDYLAKPFSREELIARVNSHLDLKAAHDTFMENQRLEKALERQTQEKEMARLREEKAQLEKLRYQLNPHFLFNSLASIQGAVLIENKAAADKMITHLAAFSRLALSRGSMDTLTVARELEIIGHYFAMEQIRFGDFLKVTVNIAPEAEDVLIPSFIIQPFAENAVKYGSRTSPDALEIRITVTTPTPDTLQFQIANTGTWIQPGTTDKKHSTGTGIENTMQRLETYYADEYSYEERARHEWVIFEICLPKVMSGRNG